MLRFRSIFQWPLGVLEVPTHRHLRGHPKYSAVAPGDHSGAEQPIFEMEETVFGHLTNKDCSIMLHGPILRESTWHQGSPAVGFLTELSTAEILGK